MKYVTIIIAFVLTIFAQTAITTETIENTGKAESAATTLQFAIGQPAVGARSKEQSHCNQDISSSAGVYRIRPRSQRTIMRTNPIRLHSTRFRRIHLIQYAQSNSQSAGKLRLISKFWIFRGELWIHRLTAKFFSTGDTN